MELPDALALLPTPSATDWKGKDGPNKQWTGRLSTVLPNGAYTGPQSPDGSKYVGDQHPDQMTLMDD
jgi:hypothetical protein